MARNSLNKVQLIGNLADDPKTRAIPGSGVAVCNFTIITNEGYKDSSGNWVERAEGHRIVTFDKLAEICDKYLTKGKKIYIEGSLQTRSYEKDGVKHWSTEIKAHEMLMLDRAGDSNSNSGNYNNSGSGNYQSNNRAAAPQAPAASHEDAFAPGDDLPF
jgi:single-strand DNA-binding protein